MDPSPSHSNEPRPKTPPLNAWRGKWLALPIIVLICCGVDQWSKHWAQHDLQHRPGRRVTVVDGYLAMSYVRNPGAAWGFLARTHEDFRRPFFIGISLVAMFFILYLFRRLEPGQRMMMIALSLVMGGAVGNFIDRLRYNYVVDFIDFHIRRSFKWPTFNVADIAITVGVVLLFFEMFVLPRLRRPRTPPAEPEAGQDRDGQP